MESQLDKRNAKLIKATLYQAAANPSPPHVKYSSSKVIMPGQILSFSAASYDELSIDSRAASYISYVQERFRLERGDWIELFYQNFNHITYCASIHLLYKYEVLLK